MSRLAPEARELVRAGRAALRPTDADRERVFQALLPQVGGALGAGTPGADALSAGNKLAGSSTQAATGVTLAKASAGLIGIAGIVVGGMFLTSEPEPSASSSASVQPVQVALTEAAPAIATEPESPPVALTEPEGAPEKPAPAKSVEKRQPVAQAGASDSLAQEVEILSRAGAELHSGRPQASLKVLDEHQRKFPGGVLTQERLAARARALCALGRMSEAKAQLSLLARTKPNSPHVARIRRACGFEATGD